MEEKTDKLENNAEIRRPHGCCSESIEKHRNKENL